MIKMKCSIQCTSIRYKILLALIMTPNNIKMKRSIQHATKKSPMNLGKGDILQSTLVSIIKRNSMIIWMCDS